MVLTLHPTPERLFQNVFCSKIWHLYFSCLVSFKHVRKYRKQISLSPTFQRRKKKSRSENGKKGERKRNEEESERRNAKNKRLVSANRFLNKTPMKVMGWICYSLSKISKRIARRRRRSVATNALILQIVTTSKM